MYSGGEIDGRKAQVPEARSVCQYNILYSVQITTKWLRIKIHEQLKW